MLIAGLTGGIASGKSLVAKRFRDLGARVIDADRIVHDLLETEQPAWREVVDHFGPDILREDRSIDRRALGEIVFADREARLWLNSCLHPRVFEVYSSQVRLIGERQPRTLVVFDAALLIETGYHRTMDRLVVVYAERNQQIERLISRDRLTRLQAEQRIAAQMPLSEKRGLADYVIDNTGTCDETNRQAHEVYAKLIAEEERA